MRSTFILAFGTYIGGQDCQCEYIHGKYYGLRVWVSTSKKPESMGAIHIFIAQQNDAEALCEYDSRESLHAHWKGLDLTCKCQLDFGAALIALHTGKKVARIGWDAREWVALKTPNAQSEMNYPYIYLHEVSGALCPWSPGSTGLVAHDWKIVD